MSLCGECLDLCVKAMRVLIRVGSWLRKGWFYSQYVSLPGHVDVQRGSSTSIEIALGCRMGTAPAQEPVGNFFNITI